MSPIRMERLESAIRVVLEFHQAFNRRDVAGMMRLMSDDCALESSGPPPDGAVYVGKENIAQYWQDFFRQLSHIHIEIEEIYSFGIRCIMRWRCDWADETGKQGYIRGVDIFQVKDGLICEQLSYAKGMLRITSQEVS